MGLKRFCSLTACSLLTLPLIMGGCPPAATVVPADCIATGQCVPDQANQPLTQERPLTAALSSSRPIVIRGDVAEGTAVITAISSVNAQFEWSVDVPSAFASAESFLSFCAGPANGCNPLSDGPNIGTRDFLRISEILDDPGAQGSGVTIRVMVTAVDENDVPFGDPIEQAVTITIERRAAELALALTHPARIAPSETVTISALISGGSPFAYQGGAGEANQCPSSSFTSADASDKLRTLPPLAEGGSPEPVLSPDNQVPFCISALVREDGLDADDGEIAFQPVDGSALFEVTNDGNTRVIFSYTAPEAQGSVAVDFVVTDGRGTQIAQTAAIEVASADQLVISQALATRTEIAPGETTRIEVVATGGEAPYSVAFALLGGSPIGALGSGSCSIPRAGGSCSVDYNAPVDQVGPVQVRVTVTDAIGIVANQTATLSVKAPLLTVALRSDSTSLQPNASTGVEATIAGGTAPYDICFKLESTTGSLGSLTLANPGTCTPIQVDGIGSLSQCVCGVGSLESLLQIESGTFTAPSAAATSTVRVAVRDAVQGSPIALDAVNVVVESAGSGGTGGGGSGVISIASLTAAKTQICVGEAVNLNVVTSGGTGLIGFAWSLQSGVGSLSGSTTASPQFTGTTAGTTSISVVVNEGGGSTATGSITITTFANPTASAGLDGADADTDPDPLEICENDSSGLALGGAPTATGGTGAYTYAWTLSDGSIGTIDNTIAPNPTFSPSPGSGGSTVTACVTVSDGPAVCTHQSCVEITVSPFPLAAAVSDAANICSGESILLTATPDTAGLNYAWTGSGSIADPSMRITSATPPTNSDPSNAVSHNYSVAVTDANLCSGAATTGVVVHGNPDATITAPNVCANVTGVTASVPELLGATYAWSVSAGATGVTGLTTNEITFDVATVDVVLNVDVTSAAGCITSATPKTVVVAASPTVDIATDSDVPNPANPAVCVASAGNQATVPVVPGATSYNWTITPAGAGTITFGQGTTSILYTATAGAGADTVHLHVDILSPGCVTVGDIDVDVFDPSSGGAFGCDDAIECTLDVCGKGVCSNPNVAAGSLCNGGLDTGECDNPDTCDGAGACLSNQVLAASPCGDAGSECVIQDTCDGAGACTDNGFVTTGTSCGDAGTQCTNQDTCDGAGSCADNGFVSSGTACGDAASDCSAQDTCDGAGTCEVNHLTDGTACTDDGNDCLQDFCTNGACIHPPHGAGTICGDVANECSAQDTCDGAGGCLANDLGAGTLCGDAATECSMQDTCDGAGTCDVNDEAVGTSCGDAGTECVNQDTCDGSGGCTDNAFVSAGTTCGDAATECSMQDTCDGAGTCDVNDEAAGTSCGDAGTECVNQDTCDGSGGCTDNAFVSAGTTCGDAATECSMQDTCDGAGTCDVNDEPAGTTCGDAGTDCVIQDTCDGTGTCLDSGFETAGTLCDDGSAGTCEDVCDGTGACAGHVTDVEGPLGDPTCSDGIDNDCDGLMDGADPDCN